MNHNGAIPLTPRAYTLRLRGVDPKDNSWREALWKTHEAVNHGAKAFGDWLLTLRGGLDHTLADARIKGRKGQPDRAPTPEERKTRRILLALSWLSVESKLGAQAKYIIAAGSDPAEDRKRKVLAALEEILKARGLGDDDIKEWVDDCSASLSAAIREDAVWVNRSKAFDEVFSSQQHTLTRNDIWDMLERFFGSPEDYLAQEKISADESVAAEQEDQAKDLVQKAGQWLSSRFGTGKGANFGQMAKVYDQIAAWAGNASANLSGQAAIANLANALNSFQPPPNDLKGILDLISGPGYKSATRNLLKTLSGKSTVAAADLVALKAEATKDADKCRKKTGSKGNRPYAYTILQDVEKECGFTYLQTNGPARHSEFAVMLDHAARRVSLAHTWIKRAEAERAKCEKDAQKIQQVPAPAKKWLDDFCAERSEASGALDPYTIRWRALDGWKEVVAAWSKPNCKTKEDRIAAARALQDDPEIDKFGDIQLFEALAEDEAACVWHKDGDPSKAPDPQPLLDYAAAADAEFKKRQFKVPAYCHPHELFHPVFCDFGNSRWHICFYVHKNVKTPFPQALCLTLWTGSAMTPLSLRWQSKRLVRDLALYRKGTGSEGARVTRADRHGRAAAKVTQSEKVTIAGLFEQKDWNGRLQAPRDQLEAIARYVQKHGEDQKATTWYHRIPWLLTFSAKLQPQGPWCEYAQKQSLSPNPQHWPHAAANQKRQGLARLILSRLPGLRVLSVDLGHRHAAACAVWETLSAEQVNEACRAAGQEPPKDSDLYLHLKKKVQKRKKGKEVTVDETTIYRRIGADKLPDGTPHPAPWARLDRQFLIKLQGEAEGTREASGDEIWAVHQFEKNVGRTVPLIDRLAASGWGHTDKQKARLKDFEKRGWQKTSTNHPADESASEEMESNLYKPSLAVDELMSATVRTMRLALQRHADRARIAFAMTAQYKSMPGGRKYYFHEAKEASANDNETVRRERHIEFLQDALSLWHALFSSQSWQDDAAKALWDQYIAPLPGYQAPAEIAEGLTGKERKQKHEENRQKLQGVAHALAANEKLRNELSAQWKTRWDKDDIQWQKHLRWFKDWVVPPKKNAGNPTIRQVGGLSLTRLATLTEFRRKVQVGFYTRLRPDGTREEIKEHFGQSTLDALEHLREQRVKQLASRIVEAALGIGSENKQHWDGGRRPQQPIPEPRFAPCHAVVIEALDHYRPEETRTRRENRQLMTWSASKIKKYLSEACQLHGLHLREVQAAYTSRQDSRTGAPGIRCQDVPVQEFLQSPFWRKQVAQAREKQKKNQGDSRDQFLLALNEKYQNRGGSDSRKHGIIRVPLKGGEIFVSADKQSPAAKGLQADLNAAANIGLRALTDPDWPGKWWYVPCDPATFKPLKDKVQGSTAVKPDQALRPPPQAQSAKDKPQKKGGKTSSKKAKEAVNLWHDISTLPLASHQAGEWKNYQDYQEDVQRRVIQNLKSQSTNPHPPPASSEPEDDLTY